MNFFKVVLVEPRVAHGGIQAFVAKKILNDAEVATVLQHMTGHGPSQCMRMDTAEPGAMCETPYKGLNGCLVIRTRGKGSIARDSRNESLKLLAG